MYFSIPIAFADVGSSPAATRLHRLALLLALALAVGACGSKNPAPGTPGPGAPGAGAPPAAAAGRGGPPGGPMGMPVSVITTRIAPRSFTDRFTALGTARSNESIDVTARASSIITSIRFDEGQAVKAGQVLVELDTAEERANLALAEAQLSQAESQYRRSKALAETNAVSAADLDQLEANRLVARAQVSGARARLDTLSVKAPFAGTVGLRRVSLGDLVGPETIITTLDDSSPIKLEFGVPETYIGQLRPGMTITGTSAVYPGQPFKGTVSSIDTRVDPVTRSVLVVAKIPNDAGRLKPGMFLTVALEKKRDDVLLIPEEALVPREGRQYVFVVEDGKAMEREVTLGGRAPGLAEIRAGLAAGDLIITEGTQRVRNGVPVQIPASG